MKKLWMPLIIAVALIQESAHAQTWVARFPSSTPPRRVYHDIAYDASRKNTVIFGGFGVPFPGGTTCCYGDTWTWNGTSWTLELPPASPNARYYHSMAYDGARGEVILFGGYHTSRSTDFKDTWAWDGTTWTMKSPPVSPRARNRTAMVYDSLRQEIVMFGGGSVDSPIMSDTWIWNGTMWIERLPATVPPARYDHTMAFDAARGQVVLFGGFKDYSGIQMLNDTWVWDGTNWTQKTTPIAPSPRVGHAMTYVDFSGRVLLFGGSEQNGNGGSTFFKNDSWSWDGNQWIQEAPGANPPVKEDSRLTYDSFRQEAVLFGQYPGVTGGDSDLWVWIKRKLRTQLTSQ